ncbi:ribonuclease P protein subunit p29-like isoform X1 [Salvia splendens]|uniref:ribonuclease P protein subunit p29-like isoform X1 n=1 Tax=Salvia splendens TaxID=180675 RepID=UPI001C26674E|nr:ribonuclease P protein subunit p29-like isoform X1 [Salvia splendens]XP_042054219.1 ribonuclease P protein subunit p29-like isoform X1 [Salvia splendens]XP_042054220.1 ribonuclease P protein subunit p29-like isoform X1 [Salvia splendens]XP_042054221.1 ribonuclease P protein subunit p29-like isoform X1 [Salvia splendens]
MEDQRRRSLEALERRFSQAKSEVQSQQQMSKKRPAEDKKTFFVDSPLNKPLSISSSKKGNFSFPDRTSKEDTEVNEPAYLKLSHFVHENLLPTGVQVSEGKVTVNGVLHELFQHGDSAKKYMQGSKNIKIENTILLDNFVQRSGSSNSGHMRAQQHGSKRSIKHMSLKQHKSIGTFDLPKAFHNFDIFKAMHEKWKSYIQKLLKIAGREQLAQCFLNVDLHGAIILVVQCKTAAYVGLHGIMVRETKETFGIVTQDSKFEVVPKKLSVFMLEANHWKITLNGDKLVSRNLVP